jgi:hypothetical protein
MRNLRFLLLTIALLVSSRSVALSAANQKNLAQLKAYDDNPKINFFDKKEIKTFIQDNQCRQTLRTLRLKVVNSCEDKINNVKNTKANDNDCAAALTLALPKTRFYVQNGHCLSETPPLKKLPTPPPSAAVNTCSAARIAIGFKYTPKDPNDHVLVNMTQIFVGLKDDTIADAKKFVLTFNLVLEACGLKTDLKKNDIPRLVNSGKESKLSRPDCAAKTGSALYTLLNSKPLCTYMWQNPSTDVSNHYRTLRAEFKELKSDFQ